MTGARLGAVAVALVLAFAGCSKSSHRLVGPGEAPTGPRLATIATFRLSAHMSPDSATLAFGSRQAVAVIVPDSLKSSGDTTRVRSFTWVGDTGWVYVDSSVTRIPSNSMVLTGPVSLRKHSAGLTVYVVDTVTVHRSAAPGHAALKDTTYREIVAAARMGIGFIPISAANVSPVAAVWGDSLARPKSEVPDSVLLPYGAGGTVRIIARTPAGADTAGSDWQYVWETDPNVIALDGTIPLSSRIKPYYVIGQGSSSTLENSSWIKGYVTRPIPTYTVKDGKVSVSGNIPDTLAVGRLAVGFKVATLRDVTADYWLYRVTRSLEGSAYTEVDSATAQFVNNDADLTPLRAGNLGINGILLSERHDLKGQHYSGTVLFTVPGTFELRNLGIEGDTKAQVPQLDYTVQGPRNTLALTYPDSRGLISLGRDLELQWSGARGADTMMLRVQQSLLGSDDTLAVPVTLNIKLIDSQRHTIQIAAPDNGRFTLSAAQISGLVPGMVEVVLNRTLTIPAETRGASTTVVTTIHMILENHSWFFLR